MNRYMASKRGNPRCACLPPASRNHKKERKICPSVGKKSKENKIKKSKVKKVLKNLNEYSENESSNRELSEKSSIQIVPSAESVIYIGTTYQPQIGQYNTSQVGQYDPLQVGQYNKIPVINLTNKEALKTLYFNQKNFDRDLKLRKSLNTTSLVTLPVIKKFLPKKLHSTSVLGTPDNKNRLSVLDIPPQFLSREDFLFDDFNTIKKCCLLTDSDNDVIKWILQRENEYFDLDVSLGSNSSGYSSSLDTKLSVEDMIKVYQVSSQDDFD